MKPGLIAVPPGSRAFDPDLCGLLKQPAASDQGALAFRFEHDQAIVRVPGVTLTTAPTSREWKSIPQNSRTRRRMRRAVEA